ncbi:RAD52 motif-containing protein 1 isoform X2 [Gouania willdenowi]|uniref:RAD52 motif-containing protein 1 isoform X2 n=1 Tax=Gouania willdenowi TaxID=441366 RepID=UPI001056124E|nr:RAD52 motif-containing protein 1 isoform X2 [Gouania willdenowi]
MQVDILEFVLPVENNKTLFVWDIQPNHGHAQIHLELSALFSSFGPLYLLKVSPNAPLQPLGFYAIVKFYSAAQAERAQRETDGRTLLHSSTLKVRLSTKKLPHFLSGCSRPLNHARCLELANHCLGFNGWTSDIIMVKDLPPEDEEVVGEDEGAEPQWRRRLRIGCVLRLCFPQHGRSTKGVSVMEDEAVCSGPEDFLQRRCRLQRLVRENALVQAFSNVLLILLGNGKVMVELKHNDLNADDQTEEVLQLE